MNQLTFSIEDFLQEFWHKKPTVIKGGFADFQDPISPDELAGLTMEEEVDSRLVTNLNNDWQAKHGPFDEETLTQLPDTHWQLIAQAANHWHQPLAELTTPFSKIPNWIFDDVMICCSAPQGGVGPHIDQYDVFIIQGMGKRRWRVGDKDVGQYQENHRAAALKQIESFDAIIDEVLEPGDILYIPPGFPHEGNTLELSLSYSIGYRSPKSQELLSNLADYCIQNELGDEHLHDPQLVSQTSSAMIQTRDQHNLEKMLRGLLDNPESMLAFTGEMLSRSRHHLDLLVPEEAYSLDEVKSLCAEGAYLEKVLGLRVFFHQQQPNILYINGEQIQLSTHQEEIASLLCEQAGFELTQAHEESYQLIQDLVNLGYWYFN